MLPAEKSVPTSCEATTVTTCESGRVISMRMLMAPTAGRAPSRVMLHVKPQLGALGFQLGLLAATPAMAVYAPVVPSIFSHEPPTLLPYDDTVVDPAGILPLRYSCALMPINNCWAPGPAVVFM
ncbi:MAG: hypothetical protein RL254_1992 [Planctomycetota bacterium]